MPITWKTKFLNSTFLVFQSGAGEVDVFFVFGMDFSEGVRLIKDMMSPKVLVVASEDATALCMKNRVSFTQLIRPFGRTPKKSKLF